MKKSQRWKHKLRNKIIGKVKNGERAKRFGRRRI